MKTSGPALGLVLLLAAVITVPSAAIAVPSQAAQSLAFDDEFDGPSLDTTQWAALQRGGDASNSESECYLASNATVSDGNLSLVSMADRSGCAAIGTTYRYSSSMVQWSTFNFQYGTIEARIRFAGGQGTWPAMWLLGANCQQSNIASADNIAPCDWPNPGSDEIDIAEILGSQRTGVNQAVHSSRGNPGCGANTSDVSADFHVYTLNWQPDQLTWQIDGATTCTISQAVPSHPMFLMINTALGGQGGPVEPSSLPQTTVVDYVRVTSP